MTRFEGKIAVITGGGGALGGSMAEQLIQEGAKVVLLERSKSLADAKVKEIDPSGTHSLSLEVDVLNLDSLRRSKEKILERFGTIDYLINAAGGNQKGATIAPEENIFDLSMDAMKMVTDLNLFGTVYPSIIFGEVFASKMKGAILNISSMAVDRVISRVIGYSASKAAMENFTRSMAVEMALKFGEGIRVNAIAPGFFIGEQNRFLLLNDDGSYTERGYSIIRNTPMKRFGEHHEVVGASLFLLSDEASFITGAVLPIDGGFSAFSGV
jgi:NAD(P)-dependent dehydrogenase (short-subunit alcohol dehydrogenase family)